MVGVGNVLAPTVPSNTSWRNFFKHFLQMFAAMFVGMFLGGAVFGGIVALAGITLDEGIVRFPTLWMAIMAVGMTAPMVAWMRYRHHGWRPTMEMAGVMIALALPFIFLLQVGAISREQCGLYCAVMIPAMLVVMLFRRAEYSQDHRRHPHGSNHHG